MKKSSKVALGLTITFAIIIVIALVVVGFLGIVKVPFVTSTPQEAYNSYEITGLTTSYLDMIEQYTGDAVDLPDLSVLDSYGLEYHFYGTDDSASVVDAHYVYVLSGWNEEYKDSGPGWSVGLYRNIAYGFGYAVGQHSRIKQLTGYNTLYVTLDGPLTSWEQLMSDIEDAT